MKTFFKKITPLVFNILDRVISSQLDAIFFWELANARKANRHCSLKFLVQISMIFYYI